MADSSQSGFFTQIMNCLSSKSQTTAMINDVLGGWPRWMRKSGLLDCVCKYCKYWDQTETCQTGAPRQGQPDIYLANCCWRPSLAHHTILIIQNWEKLCKTEQNCAKLSKTLQNWANCTKIVAGFRLLHTVLILAGQNCTKSNWEPIHMIELSV